MLQKIEHYISALAQLEQAVAIYQKSQQDALYRDGLIQRFEFTVELAWKSIKEYLEDQGSTTPIATPRAVLLFPPAPALKLFPLGFQFFLGLVEIVHFQNDLPRGLLHIGPPGAFNAAGLATHLGYLPAALWQSGRPDCGDCQDS